MSSGGKKSEGMEINPGIILHKEQVQDGDQLCYVFAIEVKKMKVVEFVADFNGSENIELDGKNNLVSVTNIKPFERSVIARLILKRDWKLKSKFKFTLKTPPRGFQEKYLRSTIEEHEKMLEDAHSLLRKLPVAVNSVSEINSYLESHNFNFVDLDFPPNDSSIFCPMVDTSNFDTLVHWRRPHEFMKPDENKGLKEPTIFYDAIDPSDIKQGCLGNCWTMCALACLAERPSLVERLFVTKEINPNSIYRVKLCKNGEWVTVTVDDFFPCYPLASPLFSKTHGNELWVLLLEKAYAKLHGSYFSLRGGFTSEALIDLTGCPTSCYQFDDEDVQPLIENGGMWEEIKSFDDEGYLLSVSTPGEDRWTEQGYTDDGDNNGLLPGHGYSVISVKELKNHKLLKLRNPWGNFEWKGDWGSESKLWSDEMRQALNPNLSGDDGTFWMSFDEVFRNFYCMNVCKVRNWDEVRIKGKFIKIHELDDPKIELVVSKWYYAIEIENKTKVIISIHQEDERTSGVATQRPYLDISVAILKRKDAKTESLFQFSEFKFERQVDMEVELEAGSYIILPRTTGCALRKPEESSNEQVRLIDQYGNLTEEASSTISDVFRKFDMLLNRELSYTEFKGFYECINKSISEKDFKTDVLSKFCSSGKGLTLSGFLQFWGDRIRKLGEEAIFSWFDLLGYDRSLFSMRSRAFILSLHSTRQLAVTVRDAIQFDYDNKTNAKIIQMHGREMETKQKAQGVKAMYHLSKSVHAYSYGVTNNQKVPVEVTLNCSGSKDMNFSTKSPMIKKRVEPGETEFMLHAEALQTVENFTWSAVCTWIDLKD